MESGFFVLREQYADLGQFFQWSLKEFWKKIVIDILLQEMILGELRSNFHSCSLHNFVKFVE